MSPIGGTLVVSMRRRWLRRSYRLMTCRPCWRRFAAPTTRPRYRYQWTIRPDSPMVSDGVGNGNGAVKKSDIGLIYLEARRSRLEPRCDPARGAHEQTAPSTALP